jgi:hypothetical protein
VIVDEIKNLEMYCVHCDNEWTIIYVADMPPLFSERRCPWCKSFGGRPAYMPMTYDTSPVVSLVGEFMNQEDLIRRLYGAYGIHKPWYPNPFRCITFCLLCDAPIGISCLSHTPGWKDVSKFWEWAESDIVE